MNWKNKFLKNDRFFETENGILYKGDCIEIMKKIPDESIDLIVTSPPYDKIRRYGDKQEWSFDIFKQIQNLLQKKIKKGGVIVWVVNDSTIQGSETGTSFRHQLYFLDECRLNIHDTMIYQKNNPRPFNHNRYEQMFEYMFVLSKGKPKTFNPIRIQCKNSGLERGSTYREDDGKLRKLNTKGKVNDTKIKGNIWYYSVGNMKTTVDKIQFKHPAIIPEQLQYDHIVSWSNKGDIILDPLCGSGTTLKMQEISDRRWIGIEYNEDYCEIVKQRMESMLI